MILINNKNWIKNKVEDSNNLKLHIYDKTKGLMHYNWEIYIRETVTERKQYTGISHMY